MIRCCLARRRDTESFDDFALLIGPEIVWKHDRIVYSKSGVAVSYGQVVNVINEVRRLGVDKIALVADKKKKDSTASDATVTPSN